MLGSGTTNSATGRLVTGTHTICNPCSGIFWISVSIDGVEEGSFSTLSILPPVLSSEERPQSPARSVAVELGVQNVVFFLIVFSKRREEGLSVRLWKLLDFSASAMRSRYILIARAAQGLWGVFAFVPQYADRTREAGFPPPNRCVVGAVRRTW